MFAGLKFQHLGFDDAQEARVDDPCDYQHLGIDDACDAQEEDPVGR